MGTLRNLLIPLLLAGLVVPALAQEDLASAAGEVVTDRVELTAVERWQMEPGTFLDAAEVRLADFLYVARPIVVFADSPTDPRFREQVALLEERVNDLVVRDVVVVLDSDPAAQSDARTQLRPRGFGLVLISKDGRIAQRKPVPWQVREISRSIDKMPLRRQEISEGS